MAGTHLPRNGTPIAPERREPARENAVRALARGFAALAAATYVLIVLGALVRSHGAGLSCPDWPLCFGEFVPDFDVRVAFEWTHRVLAGTLSVAFLGLSLACLSNARGRAVAGRLILVSGGVLAVQILLGALTVWHLLAAWTVTSHLIAGNAFAVSLAFIARALFRSGTGRAEERQPRRAAPAQRRSLSIAIDATGVLLFAQIVLGGLVSSTYAGLACPDWPTCIDGAWFPSFEGARAVHLLHRLCAYSLVAAIAVCALLARGAPRLGPLLLAAFGLVVAQVAVGVANVLLRLPVEVTGLHSALAALLILTLSLAAVAGHEQRLRAR